MAKSSRPELRIAPCSFEAAKYAVTKWHYSRVMPAGKLVKYGAWEEGVFIGCILFGRGANNHIGRPFSLGQTEVCELVRIALSKHQHPVSRMVAISLRLLRRGNPGMKLVISFADLIQGHHGGIYQAGNWKYLGTSQIQREVMWHGKIMHKRTAHSKFGTIRGLKPSPLLWKHKYAYPLHLSVRLESKPYPKRLASIDVDAPAIQAGEGEKQ